MPHLPPPWLRPPTNIIPVVVPLGLLVGRNQAAVIAVPAVQAFPIGMSLSLMVRARPQPDTRRGRHHAQFTYDAASEDFVRFGVEFSDGRKATNLLLPHRGQLDQPPPGPLLTPHGGGGSPGAWDTFYWLWPLPTPGRLLMVAEWPAQHIGESAVEVDADPILEAAAQATTLWPEEGNPGPAGHLRIDGGA
jgi:hypothetical protein